MLDRHPSIRTGYQKMYALEYCVVSLIGPCFIVSAITQAIHIDDLHNKTRKEEMRTLTTKHAGKIKVWSTSTSKRYTKSM